MNRRRTARLAAFVTEASFIEPPVISSESAWNGHTPFAAWAVEACQASTLVELGTHAGVSYFAFCESVQRNGLPTRCFAVDTWEGDAHAGFYDESVYAAVAGLNEARYSAFSQLLRTSFDEAADAFEPGTIDLLHIDGLHTYEAVRHDFDTWLPKLSAQGVVLLHDTNERKDDFGVYRLLEELSMDYPTFEFLHEHGLGVVAVGPNPPSIIAELTSLERGGDAEADVRDIYASMGRGRSADIEVADLRATILRRDASLEQANEGIQRRDRSLADLEAAVERRSASVDDLTAAVERRSASVDDLTAAVERRSASVDDLTAAVERRDESLRSATAALARRDAAISELRAMVARRDQELESAATELDDRGADLDVAQARALESERKWSRLRNRRSIKLALAIAGAFRPVFRAVRRVRSPRSIRSSDETVARPEDVDDQAVAPPSAGARTDVVTLVADLPMPSLQQEAANPITIIVPVYNAVEETERCLKSIIRNTNGSARLLLIDDASPDPEVAPLLEAFGLIDGIDVLTNDQNLGFVATVNIGFAATNGDVVVLNSDTEVTPGWLDRLQRASSAVPEAATVTPISDNAGAFSAPVMGEANDVPMALTRDEVGRLVARSSDRAYASGPTGNGFCMYVRRACLDEVGMFDEEAFPRGYGEENDLGMRALAEGWTNVVDGSTYVFHSRSASFGDEKHALMASGREVLDTRYPDYTKLVRSFVGSPQMEHIRSQTGAAFDGAVVGNRPQLPRVLFLLHGARGGTPATARDLADGLRGEYETFTLISDGRVVRLVQQLEDRSNREFGRWVLKAPISVMDTASREYREIVQSVLIGLDIDTVHIRHLIGHTFEAAEVAKSLNIPVVLSFHDFYYICPTVHLLDNDGVFCGGVCTSGQGVCPIPTPWLDDVPHLKHNWVYEWRKRSSRLFDSVDHFVTTADSIRDIYRNTFAELAEKPFEVIAHGRDIEISQAAVGVTPSAKEPIRILLAGNMWVHKGTRFVRGLTAAAGPQELEIHVMGEAGPELEGSVVEHGPYQREDFVERSASIGPHFVGLFSTTAESFSHVLTESWAAGIPVLVSNRGAVEERVVQSGGGWVVDVEDPKGAWDQIRNIAADADGYRSQREQAWSNAERSRTISEMAFEYSDIYGRLRFARKAFPVAGPQDLEAPVPLRVGVFVPGGPGSLYPASTHVRLLARFRSPDLVGRVVWRVVAVGRFLSETIDPDMFDVVVVQRNAIPADRVAEFVDRCADEGMGIVFELDDDLLSDDPNWAERSHYEPFMPSIDRIARTAGAVVVSTEPLARSMRDLSSSVTVLPNGLDRSLWMNGMMTGGSLNDTPMNEAAGAVFIGGPSHGDDLDLIRPAVESITRADAAFRFSVVGGVPVGESDGWYTSIEIPSSNRHYPEFTDFVRSLRGRFALGLAPLRDTRLNSTKSDLRFLEYSALGIPGIYSDCDAFSAVIDGETGLVVENTTDAWDEAIRRLIGDPQLQRRIARNAFEYVVSERLVDDQCDQLVAILESARVSQSHRLREDGK